MGDFLCPYDAWEPWPVSVHQGDGPATMVVTDDALDELPTSGRVGFTVEPGPVRVEPRRPRVRVKG